MASYIEKLDSLITEIVAFDKFYEMSDDMNFFTKGEEHFQKINKMALELGITRKEIYEVIYGK